MSPDVPDENREAADAPPRAKRILIGEPLTSQQVDDQLLPKRMALPIFASDALSSVAYAPQELVMILLIGGLTFLSFTPLVAIAVVVLLIVVVLSYRQLIKAYPSGGGDYEVASKNLGEIPGVIATKPAVSADQPARATDRGDIFVSVHALQEAASSVPPGRRRCRAFMAK